jgi:hypothetical protein
MGHFHSMIKKKQNYEDRERKSERIRKFRVIQKLAKLSGRNQ